MIRIAIIVMAIFSIISCQETRSTTQNGHTSSPASSHTVSEDSLRLEGEKHLRNIRQLTFGGDNAEAYWSFDQKSLVFQASNKAWGADCDQIYVYELDRVGDSSYRPKMVSTGKGRTTCAYYLPGDSTIIYASTHAADENCPAVPPRSVDGKYVWPIYNTYDIYITDLDGKIKKRFTEDSGYEAEATLSPDGKKLIFTSDRTGDLELYVANVDGSDLIQVTSDLGYDGGAFFSPDSKKIVWRASRPKTEEAIKEYKDLLAQGLVQPTDMELFVANVDGSDAKQVTDLGKANWAPFFHPSGQKIVFSSNHASERGFPFNLYMINIDGTGLEQITFDDTFSSFPMFSYDGKQLVFASNRNNGGTRDTNLFLAEWVD